MISAIYTEALVEFPEDIVIRVCRDWPKRAKFWPALAELVEPAERLLVERRSLAEAWRAGRGNRRSPIPRRHVGSAELAAGGRKPQPGQFADNHGRHIRLQGGGNNIAGLGEFSRIV
jgi:hypothetical protein